MAAKAFRTTEYLFITIQHEYGHVILNSKGLSGSDFHASQEATLNKLSAMQAGLWNLKDLSSGYYSNAKGYQSKIIDDVNYYSPFSYSSSLIHHKPIW